MITFDPISVNNLLSETIKHFCSLYEVGSMVTRWLARRFDVQLVGLGELVILNWP